MKQWIEQLQYRHRGHQPLPVSMPTCVCLWIHFHLMFLSFYQATSRLWLSLQEPGESKLWRTNLHIAFWVMMHALQSVLETCVQKKNTMFVSLHLFIVSANLCISKVLPQCINMIICVFLETPGNAGITGKKGIQGRNWPCTYRTIVYFTSNFNTL